MSDLQDYLNDPAREALIPQVRNKIDELGVDAIYYQYISITGRIMGKTVPAKHWERLARDGMQTWIGGITNVFADKEGNLIGFAPNASELLALPDPDTFCQLPWNKRIARVFCTVFFSREDPERPRNTWTPIPAAISVESTNSSRKITVCACVSVVNRKCCG